ncbi:hypothetical protein PC41400_06325 [Paenibacillus chitinolyticus]|uniref:Aminoglycoside phosphotransferase domain-containing protein n=1 Tax=Paenibacillus chitinolyticus TaxID=79263 RepID=A0A410WSB6_9BACL|nr:hypothetical protein [Paenibacillus chitinolyticus]MCY9591285.1 hypothetical protein [Paenibacillus chitinolyticus]MCY9595532.1 hypothetical protein [Paenibacillus chitinolyticus]QAV17299.1 hypothetical protein PC41400_06325 [Paenibacillus chitinolyticus]
METEPIRSRYFNRLTIGPDGRSVRKTSRHDKKLRDEISWYLNLPEELQTYIPGILGYSLQDQVYLCLEYIQAPTLSELYMSGRMDQEGWAGVFARLDRLFGRFASFPAELAPACLHEMYIGKTQTRMAAFLNSNERARRFYNQGYYRLNGKMVLCPFRIFESHLGGFRSLLANPAIAVLHGDLCFSNVLYAPDTQAVKLVDPRGSFGNPGIYGDRRYDLAKIRHSLNGYEHIVRGRYSLQTEGNDIRLEIPFTDGQIRLLRDWDRHLGGGLRDVAKIEALLFLSMLPLHRESPERQLALYAVATRLLYEIFAD